VPLSDEGRFLIRKNLEALQSGKRVSLVVVGHLTEIQLSAINTKRDIHGYAPVTGELVFIGQHVYNNRIVKDGYSIDDVVEQIASALDSSAIALDTSPMTSLENSKARDDAYGNSVRDRAVLECSVRHPRPEVFSVIPKGDRNKPKKKPLTIADKRLEPQRLARVTVASGAPAAAKHSMRLPESQVKAANGSNEPGKQ
jgi:hypothetical protein